MAGGQKQIFISHTDDQVGNAMQDVIQRAFDGKVRSFNTSRSARGLSSGVRIDEGLLESVQASQLFLSLWTPGAAVRPAWMAWELGVAAATHTAVLVGRALGAEIDQLPLGLGARFANDLGDEDSLVRLVEDMADILEVQADTARVREFFLSTRYPVFYAHHCPTPKLSVTAHRRYLLAENLSTGGLDELRVYYTGPEKDNQLVAESLDRALHKEGRKLAAAARIVAPVPNGSADGASPAGLQPKIQDIVVNAEWKAPGIGREWSAVTIFSEERES